MSLIITSVINCFNNSTMFNKFCRQVVSFSTKLRYFSTRKPPVPDVTRVECLSANAIQKKDEGFSFDLKKCWGGEILLIEADILQPKEKHDEDCTGEHRGGVFC